MSPESPHQRVRRLSKLRRTGMLCFVFGGFLVFVNAFIGTAILFGDLTETSWKVAAVCGIAIGLLLALMDNFLWQKARTT